jgi:hypothetical protein
VKTKNGATKIEYERFCGLAEPVVKDVFSRYQDTFGKAYKKEKGESRWRTYSLFIIGGCSRIDVMRGALEKKP